MLFKKDHSLDYYNDRDLHDVAGDTHREDEINDYIYEQNYGYDKNILYLKRRTMLVSNIYFQ